MTFTVIWKMSAYQSVEAIAATAEDPGRVKAAQDRIDFMLRRYARDLGESRDPGFRIWYEDVLGVYYHIDETAMRVEVLYAGPSRRK
jgi:hypothetical protein